MVKQLWKDVVRGACYLDGYGSHPGTIFLVYMVALGALAGYGDKGYAGAMIGALIMLVTIGPFWCVGCVGRAREYQRTTDQSS